MKPKKEIEVDQKTVDGITIFELKGELITTTVETFISKLNKANSTNAIIFDMQALVRMDNEGMRVLSRFLDKKLKDGGSVVACDVTHDLRDSLKISGFDRILPIISTQEMALSHLRKR